MLTEYKTPLLSKDFFGRVHNLQSWYLGRCIKLNKRNWKWGSSVNSLRVLLFVTSFSTKLKTQRVFLQYGNYLLSNWDSSQCGSNQSLRDPFAMFPLPFPLPTSSLRLSNLFSLPVPLILLSASFSFCLNRCFRLDEFNSGCFDCEGGAPWGPR